MRIGERVLPRGILLATALAAVALAGCSRQPENPTPSITEPAGTIKPINPNQVFAEKPRGGAAGPAEAPPTPMKAVETAPPKGWLEYRSSRGIKFYYPPTLQALPLTGDCLYPYGTGSDLGSMGNAPIRVCVNFIDAIPVQMSLKDAADREIEKANAQRDRQGYRIVKTEAIETKGFKAVQVHIQDTKNGSDRRQVALFINNIGGTKYFLSLSLIGTTPSFENVAADFQKMVATLEPSF